MRRDYGSWWRSCRAAAAALVATVGVTNLFAQAMKPPVSRRGLDQAEPDRTVPGPAWRVEVEAGIEWACLVGRGATESVLVATRDARLLVVNTGTGEVREAQPQPRRRGVRAAQPAADHPLLAHVAYVFDRHGAWAIRLDGDTGPAWQYGDDSGQAGFDNDPEVLTGWTNARVTSTGLLLLNSDGRLVLLSLPDGGRRWQVNLGRLPTAVLHTTADAALVLWKTGGTTQAAFVSLTETHPTPRLRTLADAWPLWSTPCGDGLLTLGPHQAAVWPQAGPVRRLPISAVAASAARAALRGPSAAQAGDPLLLLAEGRRVVAIRVTDGGSLWSFESRAGDEFATLTLHAERCLAAHGRGFTVLEAGTGQLLAEHGRPVAARLAAAQIAGDAVHALYTPSTSTSDDANAAAATPAELYRVPLATTPTPRPAQTPPVLRPLLPPHWRDALWTKRWMVLVGSHGLWAYELP